MDLNELQRLTFKLQHFHALFYNAWSAGTPVFSDIPDTACVTFDKKGSAIQYLFNKDFWETLNDTEKMFVFCHEILHVVLRHGSRTGGKFDKLTNFALDIPINHMLMSQFQFDREQMPVLKDKLCIVDTIFKNDPDVLTDQSFEYYYLLLKKKYPHLDASKYIFIGGCHDPNGNISGDIEDIEDYIEQYLGESLSKDELKDIEEKLGKQAGIIGGTKILKITDPPPLKLRKWEIVIKKIAFKCLKDLMIERWNPKNRRIAGVNMDDLFLPSIVENENPIREKAKLWVFIDTSGSCEGMAHRFYKASQTIPLDKFEINFFCFDTNIYPVKRGELKGFGGTMFNIIEDYIIANTKLYPDLVFVITDGFGSNVSPQFSKRWHWFLTENGSTSYIPSDSHVYKLSEFE